MKALGYFCSYTPLELLEACDLEGVHFSPNFMPPQSSSFPVPFCALCKSFTDWACNHRGLSGFVIPLSCDASRRTYEVLQSSSVSVFPLDIPVSSSQRAVLYLADRLKSLALKLLKMSGSSFAVCVEHLQDILQTMSKKQQEFWKKWAEVQGNSDRIPILLLGSHFAHHILPLLESKGFLVLADLPENRSSLLEAFPVLSRSPFEDLARLLLLHRLPCPCFPGDRRRILKSLCEEFPIQGVIIFFSKFCDFQLYEIGLLRRELGLPILLLEHDLTPSFAQWETRIDAFLEAIHHG